MELIAVGVVLLMLASVVFHIAEWRRRVGRPKFQGGLHGLQEVKDERTGKVLAWRHVPYDPEKVQRCEHMGCTVLLLPPDTRCARHDPRYGKREDLDE